MRKNTSKFFFFAGFTILLFIIAFTACSATGDRESVSGETLNSIKDRLRHLEDREEIRRVLMDYGRFLDRRDFESFARLFAEKDGEWIGGMGKAKGRQAILDLMEETIGVNSLGIEPNNYHLFANDSIDLDGDSATAVTKWVFMVPNADGQPEPFYLGHYEDTLVREKGQWKFLRRVVYSDIPADNPEAGRTE